MVMRKLNYAVEGKVANLDTFAVDEPGHGGACRHYRIVNPLAKKPTIEELDAILNGGGDPYPGASEIAHGVDVYFQNGPINEDGNGVNGVQHEDLLAIVIDRLEGFQSGEYKSAYNGNALHHLKKALDELQNRTRDRMFRGVEGTHQI